MCSSTRLETMQCLHPVEYSLLHSILRYSLYMKTKGYILQAIKNWTVGRPGTDHEIQLELLPCKIYGCLYIK